MKQQPPDGVAAAESLYTFDEDVDTDSNVANLEDIINVITRPSLVPGVEYPTTDREELLLDLAYAAGFNEARRIFDKESSFLEVLRDKVEQIRKEKIEKGHIEPADKKERKWRLGL